MKAEYVASNHFMFVSIGPAGAADSTGIITWDPLDRRIVSWGFGADGSMGRNIWRPMPDGWTAQAYDVLPDGRTGKHTCIFKKVDNNTFLFNTQDRTISGRPAPDGAVVKFTRD